MVQGEVKLRSENQLIFTLPSGYRPIDNKYAPVTFGNLAYGEIRINTSGVCAIYSISSNVTARVFINMSFSLDY